MLEGGILGIVWPIKKQQVCDAVYAAKGIIQYPITADSATDAADFQRSQLAGVTLHCAREKYGPCDAAFHQNSLTTCFVFQQDTASGVQV